MGCPPTDPAGSATRAAAAPRSRVAARDAALTWLVQRAQDEGGAWLVGLAGVLPPGVGRRVYPLCRAFPRLAHDLEAEALAGLLQAVQAWRLGQDRVASRLVWAAARCAWSRGSGPSARLGSVIWELRR
jgi:hypothetical protein